MERLCYLAILKGGFSAYSSPVMLISRKVMNINRVVTDFRHHNIRIAKNNLSYPSLRNTFLVLGSSIKCQVLSVLDLKDIFHFCDSQKIQKDIVEYCHILVVPHIYIKEYLWD